MVPNAHDGHNVVECTNHHIEEEQQEEPVVLKAYAVVYPCFNQIIQINLVNSK